MNEVIDRRESISYAKLYRQWERTNWSATEIDFSRDIEDWREELDDKQREALLWNYSLFLVGEEAVARDLTPVLDAAEGFAESIFLTTQIVDEARVTTSSSTASCERSQAWGPTGLDARRRRLVSDLGIQAGVR